MKTNLILFDGISGSGKSSRVKTIAEYLREETNLNVTTFFEPHHLRGKITEYRKDPDRDPRKELELFVKDRKLGLENYSHKLGEKGEIVLGDRSFISTLAYQSLQGIPIEEIKTLNSFYPTPDIAFIFLCDPEIAAQRIAKRKEQEGKKFSLEETTEKISKIRERYIEISEDLPYARVIETNGREEAVDLILQSHINNYLGIEMNKAVFLDKDGTIVDGSGYPEIIPTDKIFENTFDPLRKIQDKGYKLFMISSQPWPARGRMTEAEVEEVFQSVTNQYKEQGIQIDGYGYCIHHRKDNCPDKKPSTRLFEKFIREYKIDTTKSYMIGDMDNDVLAGQNMGLKTIRVNSDLNDDTNPDFRINNFENLEKIII